MSQDSTNLHNLTAAEVIGLTIVGEARGEPIEGQVAVGSIIRNRLHDNPGKYHSYSEVCLEPLQFSCWNELDSNYSLLFDLADQLLAGKEFTDPILRQCLWVAQGIIDWSILDNTKGSKNYLTYDLWKNNRPSWAKTPLRDPIKIGNQVFFSV